MAQQLHARGEKAALVGLFDTLGAVDPAPLPMSERVRLHASRVERLDPLGKLGYVMGRMKARVRRMIYAALSRSGRPLPRPFRNLKEITYQAAINYRPQEYPGRVVLFRASERRPGSPSSPFLGWEHVARGGMEVHGIPGDHLSLMMEPGVRWLAQELRACIDQLMREAGGG